MSIEYRRNVKVYICTECDWEYIVKKSDKPPSYCINCTMNKIIPNKQRRDNE